MYLCGRSTEESTLKYHNHNILGKLGVSSRKQMLDTRKSCVIKKMNPLLNKQTWLELSQ